ncbi:TetR/AcrR family transcriptional regulator [Streptomyces sp. ICN988]|uniref:TetR/AcrR family transcriptional regulator n=1 Tax=Streptomyces sp. ICN988 TaxID=2983765 RepID=UPI0021E3966F|nr:TetR/AcrR family transcriptional regulator [Streptomyces sp. ICN988]MCV2463442.1 TetR/AcrR family transcriptional regulator [Streptomyces sp. ICN988]
MPSAERSGKEPADSRRADVVRNRGRLLEAAAEVFVASGLDAPVREVAAKAGVGVGTLYRHFPTRVELVVAVFRHQVEECAEAGPRLLADADSPLSALRRWIDLFVDFLVTKHGLANTLQPDSSSFVALHTYFLDRLLPAAEQLLGAAVDAGEVRPGIEPYELMRGIGNLCIAGDDDPRYDPRRMIDLLLRGLEAPPAS